MTQAALAQGAGVMPKEIAGVQLFTLVEVSELLGLSMKTLRAYVRKGKIKTVKIGRQSYVTHEFLTDFLTTPRKKEEKGAGDEAD